MITYTKILTIIPPIIHPIIKEIMNAPAYFSKLSEFDAWELAAKTDVGNYYGFLSLKRAPKLMMTTGPTLRADWVEELGLPYPETVDEWETVLTAFKEKKGATAPFSTKGLTPYLFSFSLCILLFIQRHKSLY